VAAKRVAVEQRLRETRPVGKMERRGLDAAVSRAGEQSRFGEIGQSELADKNCELEWLSSEKGNKVELLIVWHDYETQFASLTSERESAVAEKQEKMRQMKVRCGTAMTQEAEKAERVTGGLKQR
jgi:hypothetical protein